jgi:sporulation protein YlmC with PRC-barrel domain
VPVGLGTHVRTSDGKEVGTIDRLILDPQTSEVKAVVIHKGSLLPRDVEVQLSSLQAGPAGELLLAYSADQLNELSDFVESDYIAPPAQSTRQAGSAAGEALWPTGYAPPQPRGPGRGDQVDSGDVREAAVRTERDLGHAIIGTGSEIKSQDGATVGQLHQLVFDEATAQVTSLIVRKGGQNVELPASLIASVDDGVINLTATAGDLPPERAG